MSNGPEDLGDQRTVGARAQMLVERVERRLQEPAAESELQYLVADEADRIRAAMTDRNRYPVLLSSQADTGLPFELLAAKLAEKWLSLAIPLSAGSCAAARHSSSARELAPWLESLSAIAQDGEHDPRDGSFEDTPAALRRLPASMVLLSAAIGAVGSQRWANLNELIKLTLLSRFNTTEPVLFACGLWRSVGDNQAVAKLLALSVEQGFELEEAQARSRGFGEPRSPLETWLAARLRPHIAGQFRPRDDFNRLVDQTVVLLGVLETDQFRDDARWQSVMGPSWFGRASDRGRYRPGFTPLDTWWQQLDAQRGKWEPLQQGLFGGDLARALTAFQRYTEKFQRVLASR